MQHPPHCLAWHTVLQSLWDLSSLPGPAETEQCYRTGDMLVPAVLSVTLRTSQRGSQHPLLCHVVQGPPGSTIPFRRIFGVFFLQFSCGGRGGKWEGKKKTTANVGNARYRLYNRAAGPGRPYSFAIVAPCGKMHYYSWQGLRRGTQGLGGPLSWGLAAPRGHTSPTQAVRGCQGLKNEWSTLPGHPGPLWWAPLIPVNAPGVSWDAQPAQTPPWASAGMRTSSPAGPRLLSARRWHLHGWAAWGCVAAWRVGVCVPVCVVLVFLLPEQTRSDRASSLSARAPACHGSRRFPATLHGAQPLWQELSWNFNAAD